MKSMWNADYNQLELGDTKKINKLDRSLSLTIQVVTHDFEIDLPENI